jgi:hypothetical protein
MSDRDQGADQGAQAGERGRAAGRLDEAVALRSRLRDERETARDTPNELKVDAALRVADDQVAARERWLESVDDHNY